MILEVFWTRRLGGLWRPAGGLLARESTPLRRIAQSMMDDRAPDDSMIKPGGLEPAWADNDENEMRMVIRRLMGDRYGDQEADG